MGKTITSRHNHHIKDAVQLRNRRGRSDQRRIIVDGARELVRAVHGGIDLVEVFLCPQLSNNERCHQALSPD